MSKTRATYLLLTDFERVEAWCRDVTLMFHGYSVYLVGSAITRPDHRDIDLRVILPNAVWDRWWRDPVRTRLINHALSTWGQRETGLPIDFQVQRQTESEAFTGPRNMMGWRNWATLTPAGGQFGEQL